jgi:cobalt/nickel transport system permease protein
MPLTMAAVLLITQVLFYGVTPLFTISIWRLQATGYEEGLVQGFLMVWRVAAGVLLILFLTMSTPAHKLLSAVSWFKMPKVFVELSMLVYRYIFVLIEEGETIKDAQKVRLGYQNWQQSMRSLGILGGSLILRAYNRAERVVEALSARGYTGSMSLNYGMAKPVRSDYIFAFCSAGILTFLYLMGIAVK